MTPSKALQEAFGRSAKDRGRRFTLRAATVHPVSTRRSTTGFCFAIDAPSRPGSIDKQNDVAGDL